MDTSNYKLHGITSKRIPIIKNMDAGMTITNQAQLWGQTLWVLSERRCNINIGIQTVERNCKSFNRVYIGLIVC
jgi:hypothetical protein